MGQRKREIPYHDTFVKFNDLQLTVPSPTSEGPVENFSTKPGYPLPRPSSPRRFQRSNFRVEEKSRNSLPRPRQSFVAHPPHRDNRLQIHKTQNPNPPHYPRKVRLRLHLLRLLLLRHRIRPSPLLRHSQHLRLQLLRLPRRDPPPNLLHTRNPN
jgi:hypothetical protein